MDVSLNGEKECKIETVITGILNEEKPIITIHYGGTTRQLDTIGFYPEDMDGYSFVLTVENEKFSQIKWNYPMLFKVKEKLSALSEEQLVIEQNNIEFQRKIRIREIVRELMTQKNNLAKWIDNESIVDIYKEFTKTQNLSYLDLPAILYLMIKLDGKKVSQEIKHIVIDEAQDYSMLQFIVLKELTGCRSYTIVGDANQRLIKVEETPAMLRLKSLFGGFVKNYALNKSYRSTFQIMEYASKLLNEDAIVPFVRKGKYDVEEIDVKDQDDLIDTILETLEDYDDENYDNIAIITKDKEQLRRIAPELKKFTKLLAFDREDVIYRGGKVIVPSYYAKGLEFDGVIIVNFDDNTDDLVKCLYI